MHDLVSVCIPTYNGAEYLEDCLRSVISQTYSNIEILVIDEGSSDSTIDIIKSYLDQDSRVRLIINDQRLGLVPNWNKCLKEARGEWIKFQFQDDLMDTDCIQKMYNVGRMHNTNLVLSDREYKCADIERQKFFNGIETLAKALEKDEVLITPARVAEIMMSNGLKHNFMGEPIVGLINRTVFDKYGVFDERYRQIVDFEYWLRVALNEPVSFVHQKLNMFRIHQDSVSSQNLNTNGPNPTYTDRVLLILDILESPFFKNIRDMLGKSGLQSLRPLLKYYVKKVGFWRAIINVDSRVLRYYRWRDLLL